MTEQQQSFFSHYTYQVLNPRHEKINYMHNETQTKAAVLTFVSQWKSLVVLVDIAAVSF